jgi:hypothetical protein
LDLVKSSARRDSYYFVRAGAVLLLLRFCVIIIYCARLSLAPPAIRVRLVFNIV